MPIDFQGPTRPVYKQEFQLVRKINPMNLIKASLTKKLPYYRRGRIGWEREDLRKDWMSKRRDVAGGWLAREALFFPIENVSPNQDLKVRGMVESAAHWEGCFELIYFWYFPIVICKAIFANYTSIDPKQQQTMFPRRSCAIKNSLGIPFLKKETKEKKENKPRNPSWNKKEGGKSWRNTMPQHWETSPTTLPGTRWNQDMMMEQNARKLGKQSPEPYPKPKGLRKWWWNRMPEYPEPIWWNKTVSKKSWEPPSTPEIFRQQAPEPKPEPENVMEQDAKKIER